VRVERLQSHDEVFVEKTQAPGGDTTCNWKNLIIVTWTWRCEAKCGHGFKGLKGFRKGDEDVETKGWTCQSLQQPNGH
jgi:hypothetical protein